MDDPLFSWVHLSDIHVGHGDVAYRWDQRIVLEKLLADLARLPDRPRIDALVVTGDVAYSGAGRSADEYAKAAEWLGRVAAAVEVDPSRILVVPGNHDVNWGVDEDPGVADVMRRSRDEGVAIDTLLAAPQDRKLLAKRMGAYLDFAAAFGPFARSGAPAAPEARLYYSHTVEGRGGLKVRFVGLNTALLAGKDDKGKLAVGKEQIAEALCVSTLADGELVVVLTHHPLHSGWLKDEEATLRSVAANAHVHLSGHVHNAKSLLVSTGTGRRLAQVVAGATHMDAMSDESRPYHGYNIGSVVRDGDALALRVRPRIWLHEDEVFRADAMSVPEGETAAEHALGATLAAPSTHALRLAAPGAPPARAVIKGPTRVFISHAPEDAGLVAKLEKHLTALKREKLIETVSSESTGAVFDEASEQRNKLLASANVVLLVLSPDYILSEDCYDVEMTRAAEAHKRGEALMMPIVVRECDIPSEAPFKGLKGFPPFRDTPMGSKTIFSPPVRQSTAKEDPPPINEDQAFLNVAKGLRETLKRLSAGG